MLLITGLGRCGTSLVAKYLHTIGYEKGEMCYWHNEARAGYEYGPGWAINKDMYNDYITKNISININEEINTPFWGNINLKDRINRIDKDDIKEKPMGKIDFLKNPRFTWHSSIIETWWNIRKDLKLLILHRNIEDILKSRNKLPTQYLDPKRGNNLYEFKEDFADFYTKVLELEIPYEIIFYPNFIYKFNYLYDALCILGFNKLDFKNSINIWNTIVDFNMISNFKGDGDGQTP